MDNHPTGWPLLYETPLGMICLYGKVMEAATDRGRDALVCERCSMLRRQEANASSTPPHIPTTTTTTTSTTTKQLSFICFHFFRIKIHGKSERELMISFGDQVLSTRTSRRESKSSEGWMCNPRREYIQSWVQKFVLRRGWWWPSSRSPLWSTTFWSSRQFRHSW